MNRNRFLAYFAGLVVLVGSALAYVKYILWLGFPNGYITALGHAERKLALVFNGLSLILALCLIWLGILAGRQKVGGRLAVAVVVYLVMLAAAAALDCY